MTEPPDDYSDPWRPVTPAEAVPVAAGEMVVPPSAVDEFCRRLREGDQ